MDVCSLLEHNGPGEDRANHQWDLKGAEKLVREGAAFLVQENAELREELTDQKRVEKKLTEVGDEWIRDLVVRNKSHSSTVSIGRSFEAVPKHADETSQGEDRTGLLVKKVW